MLDPESFFRLWRADQRRRDAVLERKRAHLQVPELDPARRLKLAPRQAEHPADQEVA